MPQVPICTVDFCPAAPSRSAVLACVTLLYFFRSSNVSLWHCLAPKTCLFIVFKDFPLTLPDPKGHRYLRPQQPLVPSRTPLSSVLLQEKTWCLPWTPPSGIFKLSLSRSTISRNASHSRRSQHTLMTYFAPRLHGKKGIKRNHAHVYSCWAKHQGSGGQCGAESRRKKSADLLGALQHGDERARLTPVFCNRLIKGFKHCRGY